MLRPNNDAILPRHAISMSIFGYWRNPRYREPLLLSMERVVQRLPTFILRLYTNEARDVRALLNGHVSSMRAMRRSAWRRSSRLALCVAGAPLQRLAIVDDAEHCLQIHDVSHWHVQEADLEYIFDARNDTMTMRYLRRYNARDAVTRTPPTCVSSEAFYHIVRCQVEVVDVSTQLASYACKQIHHDKPPSAPQGATAEPAQACLLNDDIRAMVIFFL